MVNIGVSKAMLSMVDGGSKLSHSSIQNHQVTNINYKKKSVKSPSTNTILSIGHNEIVLTFDIQTTLRSSMKQG
ncbi:hypothetical protein GYH30_021156 [Glycine max]|uniref:Uncharacterized protein n=1 Tax=Glycine max TaxID=3847 RepID=A0A0R0IQ36_SOYBN|nr:hypothetical protein GYH30_021156 [Glycine max]